MAPAPAHRRGGSAGDPAVIPAPAARQRVKGALGHSLGAATAFEAVITALALHHRILPLTANHQQPDPDMQIDVVTEARERRDLRWALNCGYAFGGLNSALLMEAA